jgi:hypothetical protein
MIGNDGLAAFSMTNFAKSWRPFFKYRSALVGTILIGLVWMTLFFFLKNEHESAERAAIQNSTNLAGALEEHLARSLGEIDRTLVIIRTLYEQDKNKFDLAAWLKLSRVLNDENLKVSVVDGEGNVKLSSDGLTGQNAGEFAHYRDSSADTLTISKPIFIEGPLLHRSIRATSRVFTIPSISVAKATSGLSGLMGLFVRPADTRCRYSERTFLARIYSKGIRRPAGTIRRAI